MDDGSAPRGMHRAEDTISLSELRGAIDDCTVRVTSDSGDVDYGSMKSIDADSVRVRSFGGDLFSLPLHRVVEIERDYRWGPALAGLGIGLVTGALAMFILGPVFFHGDDALGALIFPMVGPEVGLIAGAAIGRHVIYRFIQAK